MHWPACILSGSFNYDSVISHVGRLKNISFLKHTEHLNVDIFPYVILKKKSH